jgi:hypothetical protein
MEPRIEHLTRCVLENGERALGELFQEANDRYPGFRDLLESYAAIDGDFLRAVGAHRFPPRLASLNGGRE